jgi:hypothetical protein
MSFQSTWTVALIPLGSATGIPAAAAPSWKVACTEPREARSSWSIGGEPAESRVTL